MGKVFLALFYALAISGNVWIVILHFRRHEPVMWFTLFALAVGTMIFPVIVLEAFDVLQRAYAVKHQTKETTEKSANV